MLRPRRHVGLIAVSAAALLAGCGSSHHRSTTSAPPKAARATANTTAAGATSSTSTAGAGTASAATDVCTSGKALCFTPQAFRTAYGVAPLTARGITGSGVTVVLPEGAVEPATGTAGGSSPGTTAGSDAAASGEPGPTRIVADLAAFDARFHLPPARLSVVTKLAPSAQQQLATPEEMQDAELVHALAPAATIRVLLTPPQVPLVKFAPMMFRVAAQLGNVISLSNGDGQQCFSPAERTALHASLQDAEARHVTVVNAAGDDGASEKPCQTGAGSTGAGNPQPRMKGVGLPGSDPLVLSAGGTLLLGNPTTGAYKTEKVWNSNALTGATAASNHLGATGGGYSGVYAAPSYQRGTTAGREGHRGVPDVAAAADPATGLTAVSVSSAGMTVRPTSGTSAAAPTWAAIIALADQEARRPLGFVNPAIYRIASGPDYARAFHDITTGDNTVKTVTGQTITGYSAAPGWDPVTGWGSPIASGLVPLLAHSGGGQ